MTKIHAAEVQKALAELDRWQDEKPVGWQRRFRRFPARGEARLLPAEPFGPAPQIELAHIRDISRGGIGILISTPMAKGAFWQMQLASDNVTLAALPGYCRFSREVVPGIYLAGISFGVQASLLVSLGVPAKEIRACDLPEESQSVNGEFMSADALLAEDAA